MSMIGANSDDLRTAARQLETEADIFDRSAKQLSSVLGAVKWIGTVATRFSDLWNSQHSPKLYATSAFLRDNADLLRRQADQQDRAAGSDGGQLRSLRVGAVELPSAPVLGLWNAMAPGTDLNKHMAEVIFWGGKLNDAYEFVGDFKSIQKLSGLSGLFKGAASKVPGPLAVLGGGWDVLQLVNNARAGNVDGSIRSGIDVAFDGVGLALPQVGLAKGAWDVGWQVGKFGHWVVGEKLGGDQHLIDNVIDSRYGGDLSVAEATELGTRYDGWSGFGNFIGDGAASAVSDVGKTFGKIKGLFS